MQVFLIRREQFKCLEGAPCDECYCAGNQVHRSTVLGTSDINTSVSLAGFGYSGVRTLFQNPRR